MIRSVASVARTPRFDNSWPIEADPRDWAEQQQLVPLPDDDYPHAAELHRLVG